MNPYLDIVLRSISVYVFMIIALRIFGKKELSQLNPADVILILLISNSVQNAMVGSNTTLLGGIIAAFALFVINFIFKKIMKNDTVLKKFIQDKPEILIHNGKVDFKSLAKCDINADELNEAIREHGVENYKDVKLAMLEVDGNISVISKLDSATQSIHRRKTQKSLIRDNG